MWSVYADSVEELAEAARKKGAALAPKDSTGGDESLVRKLMDSLCSPKPRKEDRGDGGVVHLMKNQPPLAKKVVEKIREGAFVEFATFPVFDDGPGESGGMKLDHGDCDESTGGSSSRRRATKEIPDLSGWSTCFTLYQVAWALGKPQMWAPLAAYREVIFRLARRYPWAQVVRYDRRFRREAAGREDVKWDEENFPLMLDVTHSPQPARIELKQGGSGGAPPRKSELRRRGACFRYNKGDGKCGFGLQCRFSHVCSVCGGDHPATLCKSSDRRGHGSSSSN